LYNKETYEELGILSSKFDTSKKPDIRKGIAEAATKLTETDFKTEVASVNGFLKYRPNTGKYYLVINKNRKNELVSSVELPEVLVERIIESYETNTTYMPILKAWSRFLLSRKFCAENADLFANYVTAEYVDEAKVALLMEEEGVNYPEAKLQCTYSDIAITSSGFLATYKVVEKLMFKWKLIENEDGTTEKKLVDRFVGTTSIDENTGEITKTEGKPNFLEEHVFAPAIHKSGDKFYSDKDLGYIYRIGKTHTLPETAKREYSNTFGGGGLYFGGQAYIQGYGSHETETLTCFIDPADIMSFQNDGMAFRADRCFVNGALMEGDLQGMYHISQYAKDSDSVIAKRFEEAVKLHAEKKAKEDVIANENEGLLKANKA